MEREYIYRCYEIELLSRESEEVIECKKNNFGFFSSRLDLKDFVAKHGKKSDCFYIDEEWVLNPTHTGQCGEDHHFQIWIYNKADKELEVYCSLEATKFINHYNRLDNLEETTFHGRKPETTKLKKKEDCWYYCRNTEQLEKGIILEPPIEYDPRIGLDFFDDSYMIFPYNAKQETDHDHILSPLVFPYDMFNNFRKHNDI